MRIHTTSKQRMRAGLQDNDFPPNTRLCALYGIVVVVGALLSAGCSSEQLKAPGVVEPSASAPVHVFALRYGTSTYPSKAIFRDGTEERLPFAWMFWVLKDGDLTYVVDTGITSERLLKRWGITGYVPLEDLLSTLGVDPAEVDGVILTHAHGDHIDGLGLFESAPVYMQAKEYQTVCSAFADRTTRSLSRGYLRSHYERLRQLEASGRLKLVDGTAQLSPHIVVHLEPYHTRGFQEIVIDAEAKTVHLVADNAYLWENIEALRPSQSFRRPEEYRAYVSRLQELDPRHNVILPGHDPEVFCRFPSKSENIVEATGGLPATASRAVAPSR